jgi:hypothetical protein
LAITSALEFIMANRARSKDMKRQGKSARTGRGQASPGGSGTPPTTAHQAAGAKPPDADRPRPDRKR